MRAKDSEVKTDYEFELELRKNLYQLALIVYGGMAKAGWGNSAPQFLGALSYLRSENRELHDKIIASEPVYQNLFKLFPYWSDDAGVVKKLVSSKGPLPAFGGLDISNEINALSNLSPKNCKNKFLTKNQLSNTKANKLSEKCRELFKGYLLNEECPLRINLPRDLVFNVLKGQFDNETLIQIIDVTWYFDEAYKEHPFSLSEEKDARYNDEFNHWRKSLPVQGKQEDRMPEVPKSFKEILIHAVKTKRTVVIGENHHESTPKAILMHNMEFLKQNNAVIFIEGVRAELQEEFNKSVEQRRPTALIEAVLNAKEDGLEPSSQYTQKNLIRTCIQEGIPVIGCEAQQSMNDDEFVNFCEDGEIQGQQASLKRMRQNYEHFKAINYANQRFPERNLHVCLIGNAHAYTYESTKLENDGVYPGIVEITNGIYVNATDSNPRQIYISKDDFFNELQQFGTLKSEAIHFINEQLFKEQSYNITSNIEVILRTPKDQGGYGLNRTEVDYAMCRIDTKYGAYVQESSAKISTSKSININNAHGKVASGYKILGHDEQEFSEKEGPITPLLPLPSQAVSICPADFQVSAPVATVTPPTNYYPFILEAGACFAAAGAVAVGTVALLGLLGVLSLSGVGIGLLLGAGVACAGLGLYGFYKTTPKSSTCPIEEIKPLMGNAYL